MKIPKDMSPEDKIQHIVENTSCVVRLGEYLSPGCPQDG